jgi:hypothetical protein
MRLTLGSLQSPKIKVTRLSYNQPRINEPALRDAKPNSCLFWSAWFIKCSIKTMTYSRQSETMATLRFLATLPNHDELATFIFGVR